MPFPRDAYISSELLHASSSDVSPAEIMDHPLKAEEMSSVSVRRRKFRQSQRQNELEQERYPENKRRIVVYDDADGDQYDARDNSPDFINMDGPQFDRESSVETPSERSVLTPDEPHPHRATFGQPNPYETNTRLPLKIETSGDEEVLEMALDDDRIVVPPSPRPVLHASLASWSDFRYDRYSMVLDSSVPSEALSPDVDVDESFSPVETATPISFRQPKTRPSLISIVSISKGGKRRNTTPPSPLSQELPLQPAKRPARRPSSSSSHSGFPAAEATLFEIPDLPANAIELIANASQESLPLSTFPWKESKPRTLRRSNVPRLSTALNHTRMSSIKNLIKTPTAATHSRNFSHASSHHSQNSASSISGVDAISTLKSMAFSSNARSSTVMTRPSTAMSTSSSGSYNPLMTALPCLPTPPTENGAGDDTRSMIRKKPFSNLRRRSESLGQAIKGLGKISTKHDTPMPPALPTPRRQLLFDHHAKSPTPPLPSPRTGMSSLSAGSSTSDFTRSSSSGHIGLGLRNV
ncbi:hypothetical protein LTR20_005862 [Exophiala xenobiotica]|nr:hypothetical protein LTS13_011094 [Exophiala xenobiotica]KAK5396164.1 hypothetical protein LTR79_006918 [Exophiala xenobiotica]KAK5424117.1 hypothetical protein LTR90_001463 [Exophiala xenobiotica]KAK5461913.1 hypothetical protein LTR20_005862 [Exophiala xenobiotica]KAK5479921.1 hypothetical protein LTR26_007774 [Exophiala xenobiotica]